MHDCDASCAITLCFEVISKYFHDEIEVSQRYQLNSVISLQTKSATSTESLVCTIILLVTSMFLHTPILFSSELLLLRNTIFCRSRIINYMDMLTINHTHTLIKALLNYVLRNFNTVCKKKLTYSKVK